MQTIIRPSRDCKGYRLKCRFKIEPHPSQSRLNREKVIIAARFVADMHKQGWEHDLRHPFNMTGPYPMVTPVTIRPRRPPTAREMLPYVQSGARFLDEGENTARPMPVLALSEWWEYEIAGVFVREQLMTEYPDKHEEEL